MRKLILLFAVAAMLSGCLDQKVEPNKFQPVYPGLVIYNGGAITNQMALQTSDIAARMAMLLAESDAQGLDDLEDISVSDIGRVQNYFFGVAPRTEIKKTETGYTISFSDSKGLKDDFVRKGTYVINNNGKQLLSETTQAAPWRITFDGGYIRLAEDAYTDPIHYESGVTTIYAIGANSYRIELANIQCSMDDRFTSDWSGSFTWTPVAPNLTVTSNLKKASKFSGEGYGESLYSFNNISAAAMTYRLENGIMPSYRTLGSGTETCRLHSTADYNPIEFPAPDVKVTWENNGSVYTVLYNGISVSSAN